jgi:hypothetical protein
VVRDAGGLREREGGGALVAGFEQVQGKVAAAGVERLLRAIEPSDERALLIRWHRRGDLGAHARHLAPDRRRRCPLDGSEQQDEGKDEAAHDRREQANRSVVLFARPATAL